MPILRSSHPLLNMLATWRLRAVAAFAAIQHGSVYVMPGSENDGALSSFGWKNQPERSTRKETPNVLCLKAVHLRMKDSGMSCVAWRT